MLVGVVAACKAACVAAGHKRRVICCWQVRKLGLKVSAASDAPSWKAEASGSVPDLPVPSLSLREFLLGLDHGKYARPSRLQGIQQQPASSEDSVREDQRSGLQLQEPSRPCLEHGNHDARALESSESSQSWVNGVEDFFVVADWSDWAFEVMERGSGSGETELKLEVQLRHTGGEFQIVCDKDWSRVLYPGEAGEAGEAEALGPDSGGHGRNWSLNGQAGDKFLLRLLLRHDGPVVSWELVEPGVEDHEYQDPYLGHSGHEARGWQEAIQQLEEVRRWGQDHQVRSLRSEALKLCGEAGASAPALQLLEEIWSEDKQANEPSQADYQAVLRACELDALGGETAREAGAAIKQEMAERGEGQPDRFCLTPRVWWHRDVRRMGCGANNTLDWQGGDPLPVPPTARSWLLPASDTMAVEIAQQQDALREAGWMVLSCDPNIVRRLDDKVSLQALARDSGLCAYFPERFAVPELASYPCILKPAAGEFGSGVQIVYSPESVRRIAGLDSGELTSQWLLQELVIGCYEYSTSLLVVDGRILEKACIRYKYDAEEYVWPDVTELAKELVEPSELEMNVMQKLVQGYSGFVNFNYKFRQRDGQMLIMEANARVGADLACDVPRPHARSMLEMLDRGMYRGQENGLDLQPQ